MSDDPETVRQIAKLSSSDRPLLVVDVDDVLIEFIRPFPRYLAAQGFELRLDSFRLTGNIYRLADGIVVERGDVEVLTDSFYAAQADWQDAVEGALDALRRIGVMAEVVMLTAMPHRHHAIRRAHLDRLGFHFPLLTTEMAKGPAIARLRGVNQRPVAFVDDQPRNLLSARETVPDSALFHLMADNSLRRLMPALAHGAHTVENWTDALPRIASALGLRLA